MGIKEMAHLAKAGFNLSLTDYEAVEFAEAYASSRLAEVTEMLSWFNASNGEPRPLTALELADRAVWYARDHHPVAMKKVEDALAEVSAQLADAVMFLRIVLTRKGVTTLDCLKPKIADWLKRKGYEGSIVREGE
jgi:hypothetical protein